LTGERLAHAIHVAVTDEPMRKRAADFGDIIRAEDGVGNAMRVLGRLGSETS
jgi:hypothetical protein